MKNMRWKAVAAVATALLSTLMLAPAPAYAYETSTCRADDRDVCTTGTISANTKTHSVSMKVYVASGAEKGTCVVYDSSNYEEVGRIRTTSTLSIFKKISGLYGSYWMGCFVDNGKGSVIGILMNSD